VNEPEPEPRIWREHMMVDEDNAPDDDNERNHDERALAMEAATAIMSEDELRAEHKAGDAPNEGEWQSALSNALNEREADI
jgi:hypothetical protein